MACLDRNEDDETPEILNQSGTLLVMQVRKLQRDPDTTTARTIRFPGRLRSRLASDAERCGRSFEGQVLAILRSHYGENVDIVRSPDTILELARGSLAGISRADQRRLTRRLEASARW